MKFNIARNSRMYRLPPYVFAEVNALKMERRRAGEDIIDLGMGNPDLATPQHIIDKLVEAAQKSHNHRYSASRGITRLRDAITRWASACSFASVGRTMRRNGRRTPTKCLR